MLSIHLLSSPMFFSPRLRYFLYVVSSRWTPTALSLVTTRWQNAVFFFLDLPSQFHFGGYFLFTYDALILPSPLADTLLLKRKEKKNSAVKTEDSWLV